MLQTNSIFDFYRLFAKNKTQVYFPNVDHSVFRKCYTTV